MAFRVGFVKDENGNLKHKLVAIGEEGKDPNILYQVGGPFGDDCWTDAEHMDEAKAAMLEKMIDTIRNLAKIDEFWIVKTEDDLWDEFKDSINLQKLSKEEWCALRAQEGIDGKCALGWKIEAPHLDGYYKWEEAEKLREKLEKCCMI